MKSIPLPPSYESWTEVDEARLVDRRELRIDIEDTALGRHRATMKCQLVSSVAVMTSGEREALRKEIQTFDDLETPAGNEASLADLALVAEAEDGMPEGII